VAVTVSTEWDPARESLIRNNKDYNLPGWDPQRTLFPQKGAPWKTAVFFRQKILGWELCDILGRLISECGKWCHDSDLRVSLWRASRSDR